MKVLFLCKWNAGRSQMAEELFNHYTTKHIGISAGTHGITYQNKKLKEFAFFVVQVLQEKNIDVSEKIPIQLTPELVQFADKIIVMTERADLPDYVANSDKTIFWKIEDAKGKDYEFHTNMREQIDKMVKVLIDEIGYKKYK